MKNAKARERARANIQHFQKVIFVCVSGNSDAYGDTHNQRQTINTYGNSAAAEEE